MALTPRPGQLRGTITLMDRFHAFITGDDSGQTYFAYHTMFDSSTPFDDCEVGDPCVFTPIQVDAEVTSKHRLRAIEVRYERMSRPLAE